VEDGDAAELEALLSAHDAAGDFLEATPVLAATPTLTNGRLLGP
jgi:hypothetical protein